MMLTHLPTHTLPLRLERCRVTQADMLQQDVDRHFTEMFFMLFDKNKE